MEKIVISTKENKEIVDITDEVNDFLQKKNTRDGFCHLFLVHTTAALTTADLDPGTDLDMLDAYEAMVPKLKYRHPHDPSHTWQHLASTLIGVTLSVPFENHRLILGTWQRVVLVEFDGPRAREIVFSIYP